VCVCESMSYHYKHDLLLWRGRWADCRHCCSRWYRRLWPRRPRHTIWWLLNSHNSCTIIWLSENEIYFNRFEMTKWYIKPITCLKVTMQVKLSKTSPKSSLVEMSFSNVRSLSVMRVFPQVRQFAKLHHEMPKTLTKTLNIHCLVASFSLSKSE